MLKNFGWENDRIDLLFWAVGQACVTNNEIPLSSDEVKDVIGSVFVESKCTDHDVEELVSVLDEIIPKDVENFTVAMAKSNFIRYIKKYQPCGYTHYDFADLSEDFRRLFNYED